MAALMAVTLLPALQAGPCYGGVPLAVGAGIGLIGAAAAYNAAYAAPVYYAPPVYYYQPAPQGVIVQESQSAPASAPLTPPNGTLAHAQSKLAGLGYYKGPVDGSYGPRTAQAVEQFQADNSLSVSGRLDLKTLASLGITL